MPKYTLNTLKSVYVTKNVRKSSDNEFEAFKTLIPHAEAVSLYSFVEDFLYYNGGTFSLNIVQHPSTVEINNIPITSASSSQAGVLTSADYVRLVSLTSLSGVPSGSVNLGTFSGSIIPPNSNIKQALQALSNAITSSSGGGIYSSSGVIFPDCRAKVSASKSFTIDYSNDSGAFGVDDSFNYVYLSSKSGLNVAWINDNNVELYTQEQKLTLSLNQTIFNDLSSTPKGIQYAGNYHANYTLRSLVDKEYVDLRTLPTPQSPGVMLVSQNGSTWSQVNEIIYKKFSPTSSTINLPHVPLDYPSTKVYVNGVLQTTPEDYTLSGSTLTISYQINTIDKITVVYYV